MLLADHAQVADGKRPRRYRTGHEAPSASLVSGPGPGPGRAGPRRLGGEEGSSLCYLAWPPYLMPS